ncbi:hypothetical protein OC521_08460 [Vibrio vulnificus]|nr:hypothetical protein [Vibrio vulnificus]
MYGLAAVSIVFMLGDVVLNGKKISKLLVWFFLSLITIVVFSSFVNNSLNSIHSLVKMLIIISFSFFYCTIYSAKDAAKSFLNIFYIISIISLFLYFSINLTNITIPSIQIVNSNDIIYHYMGVYSYFDGFMQFRNNAIFWEPGIFASFLILALYMEMYFYNNERFVRVFVFFIALITTLSSAGIVLFFLFLLSLIIKYRVSFKTILIFAISSLLVLGVLYMVLDVINTHSIDPMRSINKLMNPTETERHRIESPINLLYLFSLNPFFGLGLDGAINEYSRLSTISLTSTSLFYLSSFGIMSIILFMPVGVFLWTNKGRFFEASIILLIYVIIINKELHLYFTSQYIVMFYIIDRLSQRKELSNE